MDEDIKVMATVCDICGTTYDVQHVVDPYDQDVNNRTTFMWLCASCEADRRDDI